MHEDCVRQTGWGLSIVEEFEKTCESRCIVESGFAEVLTRRDCILSKLQGHFVILVCRVDES